jgi:predicted nucleic acid-binding Zn ribbon protein
MAAPALATCPKERCPKPRWGKGKVKRGIGGGAGLIFKGSGFYITDYRSEGYKSAAKKESDGGKPAAAPAATAGGGGGEAKPAAPKPDTKAK